MSVGQTVPNSICTTMISVCTNQGLVIVTQDVAGVAGNTVFPPRFNVSIFENNRVQHAYLAQGTPFPFALLCFSAPPSGSGCTAPFEQYSFGCLYLDTTYQPYCTGVATCSSLGGTVWSLDTDQHFTDLRNNFTVKYMCTLCNCDLIIIYIFCLNLRANANLAYTH